MASRWDNVNKIGEIDLDLSDKDPRETGKAHVLRFGGKGTGQNVKTDFSIILNGPDPLSFQFPRIPQGSLTQNGDRFTISTSAIDVIFYYDPVNSETRFEVVIKTRAAATFTNVITLQLVGWQNFIFTRMDRFTDGTPYNRVQMGNGVWILQSADGKFIHENMKGGYQINHVSYKTHRQSSKIGCIARPHLIAADNSESWGTVDFDSQTGILTYTFDAGFLATAPLPIRWV